MAQPIAKIGKEPDAMVPQPGTGGLGDMGEGFNLSPYLSAALGLVNAATSAYQNAQISDLEGYEDAYRDYGNQFYNGTFEDMISQKQSSFIPEMPSFREIRGMTGGQVGTKIGMDALQGAQAGMRFGPLGAGIGAGVGALISGIGAAVGRRRAKDAQRKLRSERNEAIADNQMNFLMGLDTENKNIGWNAMRNITALGGPLHTNGAIWNNGVTKVGEGGSHEDNILGGVPMGVDQEGIPNLVEEGELIYNDYVYSKRIKVSKSVREKYKLRGKDNMTFAEAAEKAQKESEERPNDPISKKTLDNIMSILAMEQEKVKAKRDRNKLMEFAKGGLLGRKFSGEETYPNVLEDNTPLPLPEEYSSYVAPKNNPQGSRRRLSNSPLFGNWAENLRYAPALGALGMTAYSIFDRPDYSNPRRIENAARGFRDVTYSPLGDYMSYKPFDRMFYINPMAAQSGATKRAILNTAGGNRAAAVAGLLGAEYTYQNALGTLGRQAEEFNLGQRERVATFNRGTNQYNNEASMKAQIANADIQKARVAAISEAAKMREAIDNARGAAISTNYTNLFNNLGDIGVDVANRHDRDFLIRTGLLGNLPLREYNRLYGKDATIQEAKRRGFTDTEITKLFD